MRYSDLYRLLMHPSSISSRFQSLHSPHTRDHSVYVHNQNFGSAGLLFQRTCELFRVPSEDCSNYQRHTMSQEQRVIFEVQNCSSIPGYFTLCCAKDKLSKTLSLQVCKVQVCSSFHKLSALHKT